MRFFRICRMLVINLPSPCRYSPSIEPSYCVLKTCYNDRPRKLTAFLIS